MKQLYCETFSLKEIMDFIEEAMDQYHHNHRDRYEMTMDMGKAIAYAEAAWAMNNITEDDAHMLIELAENLIKTLQ